WREGVACAFCARRRVAAAAPVRIGESSVPVPALAKRTDRRHAGDESARAFRNGRAFAHAPPRAPGPRPQDGRSSGDRRVPPADARVAFGQTPRPRYINDVWTSATARTAERSFHLAMTFAP